MSEKTKTTKTYTAKRVAVATAPYAVIAIIVIAATGVAIGWFARSNFDSTIKLEVAEQVKELTSELKLKQ